MKNTNYKKDIYTIPHSFYEDIFPQQKKDYYIRIVIPGPIQKMRGDYESLIKIFEEILRKFSNLKIFFLGYPKDEYGYRIVQRCKEIKKQGFDLCCFDDPIPYEVWQKIFVKSDICVLPFREYFSYDLNNIELWGSTKASGSMFECIQYAKPFIVPSYFNVMEEIQTSALTYKDPEDLKKLIEDLIEDKEKLDYLKSEALCNSRKFSLKNVQEYLKKEILKV